MSLSTSLINFEDLLNSLDAKEWPSALSVEVLEGILLQNNNATDFDLVNILLVYALAFVKDPLKESYKKVYHDIEIWQAWESARCEAEVQKKIQQGQLPSDNSPESKLKRTGYRIKVIEYFRRTANWYAINRSL
jgi:hypothetical protein